MYFIYQEPIKDHALQLADMFSLSMELDRPTHHNHFDF